MVTAIASTHKAYTVPGGKRPLLLPADIPVAIKPVNLSRVRSYTKATKSMTTVHDTGNPRTNAAGEYSWLAAGRPGGSVGGYEWINDDTQIIITGYFDEETWAQGVRRGNQISHAGELAFGANVVWTRALEISCAMHGAVLEMEGIFDPGAARLHQYWTGKYCAGQILKRGIWSTVNAKIIAYAKAAAIARGGVIVDVPSTTYAPRSMPITNGKPWDGLEDATITGVKFEAQKVTAKTTINLNQRQWASTESLAVGPTIPAGTAVDLLGWVAGELVDGVSEWWIDAKGGRLWAGGIDVEPKVDPDYGKEPEHNPGLIVVNGRAYYELLNETTGELGRQITIQRNGSMHRWADSSSPIEATNPEHRELSIAETVTAYYWTRGEELELEVKGGGKYGEMIWYVASTNVNTPGNRFWSGLSDERPD